MQEPWLVITDIDGTILGPQGVSEFTRKSLHSLSRSGHVLALASGRHIEGVTAVLGDLDLRCPFVASNGAFVSLADGQIIAQNSFSREASNRVVCAISRIDMDLYITLKDDLMFLERGGRTCTKELPFAPEFAQSALSIHDREPVYKYTLRGECSNIPSVAIALQRDLGSEAHVVISDKDTIDVTPLGVNKGVGLKILCDALGIPVSRTIAFGNEGNDVDLLRTAHIGVAVGDATESVKAVADQIAGTCVKDGVAQFINRFFRFSCQKQMKA